MPRLIPPLIAIAAAVLVVVAILAQVRLANRARANERRWRSAMADADRMLRERRLESIRHRRAELTARKERPQ